MKSSSVLYREEFRPPRMLTWPLVFLVAGVIASIGARDPHERQPSALAIFVFVVVTLITVLLLEFVAVTVAVTETEVRFRFLPFYQRRIVIANIEHCEVRTYFGPRTGKVLWTRSWRPSMHCLELTTKDGAQFSIKSEHPERLLYAIDKAKERGLPSE